MFIFKPKLPRSCSYCGGIAILNDWLCSVCWHHLVRRFQPCYSPVAGSQHLGYRSLLQWYPGDGTTARLIYKLKNWPQPPRLLNLARQMLWHYCWQETRVTTTLERQTLFIPVPSRQQPAVPWDHAASLAWALATASGSKMHIPEWGHQQPKAQPQKRLQRILRQSAKYQLAQPCNFDNFSQVILVDDVLTTGATAHAVWQALGRPQKCQVWTLAWRRRSCGAADGAV